MAAQRRAGRAHGVEPDEDHRTGGERRVDSRGAGGPDEKRSVSLERRIAGLARRQRGVVSRTQLYEIGATGREIERRLDRGSLHRVHRGVYLVGHRATAAGAREMAAVLACGPRAVLSHRSAAALWNLLPYPASAPICITTATAARRKRAGIALHESVTLLRSDVRQLDGLPVTGPARTVLDLAAQLPPEELEQLVARAKKMRLLHRRELDAQLARHRRRPGVTALRAVLELEGGPAFTRSEAERRLLRIVRAAALPAPATNERRDGYELDFFWLQHRVVVEVDGWQFHSDAHAFEADRRRDAHLVAEGYTVLRFTWWQITKEPELVVARIATALALRAPE